MCGYDHQTKSVSILELFVTASVTTFHFLFTLVRFGLCDLN